MSYPIVTLLKGKEANVAHRHPWIFSGALTKRPSEETVPHGSFVRVADLKGHVLCTGSYSGKSSIAVRGFVFGDADVTIDAKWLEAKFRSADTRRIMLGYGAGSATDGYRLIFGEADGVPGLVVDRYRDVLVIQSSTAAMDGLREAVVEALVAVFAPRAIVERSDLSVRKEEGLQDRVGVLHGEFGEDETVTFSENGMTFEAHPMKGQKTGFFLDQKTLRAAISRYAKERKTLNLFSYTGAAGVAAIKGGATHVQHVDSSADALAACARSAELNKIDAMDFGTEQADAFQYLSRAAEAGTKYGLVLMDPPALIKSQRDTDEGKKAYHFLNRAALRLVEDGGVFVTSSCSHFFNEEDFAFTLRRASVQAGVELEVLEIVNQAPDHPLSVYFPESSYLKSFVCRVKHVGGATVVPEKA